MVVLIRPTGIALIKIDFVKTRENIGDIGTDYVNEEVYENFEIRLLSTHVMEGC